MFQILLPPGSVFVDSESNTPVPYYKYDLSDHTGIMNVCDVDKLSVKINDLILLV